MLLSHDAHDGALRITLHRNLDITNRAAAALQIEALIAAYRPARVVIELTSTPPSLATLSAIARAKRRCEGLDIPLALVETAAGPVPTAEPDPVREAGGDPRLPGQASAEATS
ncbi:hypothetical protein ABZZ37_13525 [Streptomyces sp. NPDC006464]|uniref:hypothetical protein n=1 Tax=Streptomyces sp. NPDC006464 TaxID=3154305 RepID=UPI0033ABA0F8